MAIENAMTMGDGGGKRKNRFAHIQVAEKAADLEQSRPAVFFGFASSAVEWPCGLFGSSTKSGGIDERG